MTRTAQRHTVPSPRWLYSDDGNLLLAATKGVALQVARSEYEPLDHVADVEFVGWMVDVGWDRENYERKRDFIEGSGYNGWWEGCAPPRDRLVTAKCMPGWEVRLCGGCDECSED